MKNEPTTEFDYEQVDRNLGFREPGEVEQDGRAIDTFKAIADWCMRPGHGGAVLTQATFSMRLDVVCWLLRPSRQAGGTTLELSQRHNVPEGTIRSEVSRLRKRLGIDSTAGGVPSAGLRRLGDKASDHTNIAK